LGDPVETYLRELSLIRSSGAAVPETSYYGPLANLLNEIGKTLKPKVRCVINLRNRGAGLPDGGLFTPNQFQKTTADEPLAGQIPERGVIEVKPTSDDAWVTADGAQVSRYWGRYRQVLVTNYRDFVLLGQDADGKPAKLEAYRLAPSERAFWAEAAHQRAMAQKHAERLTEYLKRVMLHPAPLADPKDVAWFLASYARDARARIEGIRLPALDEVRRALEDALGLKFEGEKGEHFFRSTLVQTLFYGVFSAWVLWDKQHPRTDRHARFNWHEAAFSLHVPMIRALYEQIALPSRLAPLGLVEVLDWTGAVLNRVDRPAFFDRFEEGHAVQYFYEPFLQAFDPELRKELGVWYTPPEIIQYMVARVDTVLRTELDLPDGLADPRVYVLDPCCGTGAYLVEVLRRIHATLQDKGGDALAAQDVKRAAMERVFGFEILPAPFVVSHLQLGLLLQNLGAPLSDERSERAGVYLTNALTGWEPPKGPKQQLSFPELEAERDAAEKVKREAPILVILGNPPYNAFAGVSPAEEQGLVEAYKEGLISQWGIKKFNLDDLYIRFFRLAERRIAEMTGRGVVSYISNHSWVSDPSFVVLRKRLLDSFDRFWIDNMHGNRKISEYAPDGRTSETVFAIPGFSVGIQQGVVVSLWVKSGKRADAPQVLFRDDLNAAKAVERRAQLVASLAAPDFEGHYQRATPDRSNRFSFRPSVVAAHYLEWPTLTEMCAVPPSNGLMEKRKGALMDIDRSALERRMRMYYDPEAEWKALEALGTGLTEDAAGFKAAEVRRKVQAAEQFDSANLRRYALRPFDAQWCYYSDVSPLWNRSRPALWAQCWPGNAFLLTRFRCAKHPEGVPFYFTPCVSDDHLLTPDAVAIPLQVRLSRVNRRAAARKTFFDDDAPPTANLSPAARAYLAALGIEDPDAEAATAPCCHSEPKARNPGSGTPHSVQGDRHEHGRDGRATLDSRGGCPTYALIWMHALAIGYSPAYLAENADGIRQDWPRIPLPNTKEALLASAALGRQVAALLDTENDLPGVTTGTTRPELKTIAVISREGPSTGSGSPQGLAAAALNPDAGDLDVTAGWGHAGKGGVTMPAKGKVIERAYTTQEVGALREAPLRQDELMARLGQTTFDIYLNDVACWRNIPAGVWHYTIGGYQVIKKWLSYRERDLLGRSLTPDEVREVTHMARRIAAILLLEPMLDANYERVKNAAFTWTRSTDRM